MGNIIWTYNLIADLICLLIILFFYCIELTTNNTTSLRFKKFKLIYVFLADSCIMSMLFNGVINQWIGIIPNGIIYGIRDLQIVFTMGVLIAFNMYICLLIDASGVEKYIKRVLYILSGVTLIIEIFQQLAMEGTHIDEEYNMIQAGINDIFHIYYIIVYAFAICILIIGRKDVIRKIFVCLLRTSIVSLGIAIISICYNCEAMLNLALIFPVMAAKLLMHFDSFNLELGTQTADSYDLYINELVNREKNFLVIVLTLVDSEVYTGVSRSLRSKALNMTEGAFKDKRMYKISDKKVALVSELGYHTSKDEILSKYEIFKEIYNIYKIDYKLTVMKSDTRIGKDYIKLASYIEKSSSVNSINFCNEQIVEKFTRVKYIIEQLEDINSRHDLKDTRVKVYCQPIYDLDSNSYKSAEALMRLDTEKLGIIYPDEFVPLAEEYNLIHILSLIILNKTCIEVQNILRKGYILDRISVNFSIIELRHSEFIKNIDDIVSMYDIPRDSIGVELTESRNDSDFYIVKQRVNELKQLGMQIYLDDFGTGYSNIARIMQLPIDIIKFDRSLLLIYNNKDDSDKEIKDINKDRYKFIIGNLASIFGMSRYNLLFEGVETDKDVEECRKMGAKYLQGFKFSKPIEIDKLINFLSKKENFSDENIEMCEEA